MQAAWSLYNQIDQSRRFFGRMLDSFGMGPEETPSRTVFAGPLFTLKSYGKPSPPAPLPKGEGLRKKEYNGQKPVVLAVPAPIKRAYIWDMLPDVSVIQKFLRAGIQPYLLQWERPGTKEQDAGLAEYANKCILDCLEAIEKETGQSRIFLCGHSLGGTFAAIFSSLHPDRVKGLILAGAPLHFGPGTGSLDSLVASLPQAKKLVPAQGSVPGTFLSALAFMASPGTFGIERWADQIKSLGDPSDLRLHLLVERWSLDESPLPRRLFEELVELLYRKDSFLRRELKVDGVLAAPESVAAPVLGVADKRCTIVPPRSILPFLEEIKSSDKRVLWYEGDTGVVIRHVGLLVGKTAHRRIWPEITRWVHGHN